MNFSIDEITKTWSEIELKKYKGKYQKSIYTNAKIKINASVIFDQNLRSVDFTFDINKIIEKKINFKETKGIKVDILQHQDFPNLIIICIYLKNLSFLEAYLRLLEKIIFIIYEKEDQQYNFNQISKSLLNWRKCFENESAEGLKLEEQLGLFGELVQLEKIINKGVSKKNSLIYWQGPENGLHDFKHSRFLVEVKTTLNDKEEIVITNIEQFNYVAFNNLYLCVVFFEFKESGPTLTEFIKRIEKNIFYEAEDKLLFNEKLNRAGFFDFQAHNYKTNFVVEKIKYFKILNNFPTILPNSLQKEIKDVKFKISVKNLHLFEVSDEFLK
jgi:hypothetical protein